MSQAGFWDHHLNPEIDRGCLDVVSPERPVGSGHQANIISTFNCAQPLFSCLTEFSTSAVSGFLLSNPIIPSSMVSAVVPFSVHVTLNDNAANALLAAWLNNTCVKEGLGCIVSSFETIQLPREALVVGSDCEGKATDNRESAGRVRGSGKGRVRAVKARAGQFSAVVIQPLSPRVVPPVK